MEDFKNGMKAGLENERKMDRAGKTVAVREMDWLAAWSFSMLLLTTLLAYLFFAENDHIYQSAMRWLMLLAVPVALVLFLWVEWRAKRSLNGQ